MSKHVYAANSEHDSVNDVSQGLLFAPVGAPRG